MKQIQVQRMEHSPTLNTVIMVEDVLKNAKKSIVSIAELKRMLPRQVNHNVLMLILSYLEESNKIAATLRGITWIHNANPALRKAISRSMEL